MDGPDLARAAGSTSAKPRAEIHADVGLVRRLLEDRHSELAREELRLIDEGWDNYTFRLGSEHAVRLPRRLLAVELLLKEQRHLPAIASRLPLEVPVPLVAGAPSPLFEHPWSVVPWIHGRTAERAPLSAADGERLAEALRALHRAAPADAPANPYRGVPLSERRAVVEERLARLGLGVLESAWKRALEADPAETRVWLHGDLHARNVVVRDGRVAGLIDWGDLAGGDAATDLACAWMLFDAPARRAFLAAYGAGEPERARAMGWAVSFASALLDSGEPAHVAMGREAARRLAADA